MFGNRGFISGRQETVQDRLSIVVPRWPKCCSDLQMYCSRMRPQRHGRIKMLFLLVLASLPAAGSQPMPAISEEEAIHLIKEMQDMEANTTTGRHQESELMDRVMGLVIGDASRLRLQNTEPNTSKACSWPDCAAYCVPCAKTNRYWTCLSPSVSCQVNSECVLGACFAEPGYCYADAYPQIARCFMGAVPEKPVFRNNLILRLGAAPPVPLPSEPLSKWRTWARSCMLMPVLFLIATIWFVYKICWVIDFSAGDECAWLPERRRSIVCLTIICMTLFAILQILRFVSVKTEINTIAERVAHLEHSMQHLGDLAEQLLEAERSYNHSLTSAPEACGNHNPLARHLVELLAGTLQVQFNEVDAILLLVRQTFTTSKVLLDRARASIRDTGWKIIYYPFIPSFVLIGGVVAILLTACYIWNQPKLLYHPRMQLALKSFAPIIVIFMLAAGICGAGAFFLSVVVSGYCLQVDDNLVEAGPHVHSRASV